MQQLSGLLPVWKPSGVISKDVSRRLQRRFGKLQIGHVGTLDPMAEGVLPILIGKATRLQDYLLKAPKTYEFDLVFGCETDTLDATGAVVRDGGRADVTASEIEALLPQFRGWINQVPPMYSAVLYQGQRLHELARSGKAADVPLAQLSRRVYVADLRLLEVVGSNAKLSVTCSKGLYVRCLGRDLAYALGTCATVATITRVEASLLRRSETLSLERLDQEGSTLESMLIPTDQIRLPITTIKLRTDDECRRLEYGQEIVIDKCEMTAKSQCFDLDADSELQEDSVRILKADNSMLGLGTCHNLEGNRLRIKMKRSVQ